MGATFFSPSIAALIAGTLSATGPSVSFGDSNGVSFGVTGNTLTASVAFSPDLGIKSLSAGTTRATGGEVVFSNSNGLSFGMDNGTVTGSYTVPIVPAQTVQTQNVVVPAASDATFTSGTVVFTGSNAVTVRTTTGQAIVIDSPIQTNQTQSNVQGLSAGTQVGRTGDVVFADSNGVTFGMSGSSRVTAGFSSVVFSNSNNVSFGLNASTLTATVTVTYPAQTVQTQGVVVPSAGTQTATSGTVVFSNSNGVSFGMSGSSRITASYSQSTAPGAFAAGTQTATSGTLVLSDSNGISFGMSGGTRITASYTVPSTAGLISAVNLSAGTTSNNASAFVFSNSNNVSFGLNGSTVTATATVAQSAQTQNVVVPSAGTQTATSGTVVFSNSNGISFGMSGSTRVTASYTVPSTAGLISAVNVSAGTTSNNLSALTFSNANGVTFGLDGSTVTASVSPGGGGLTNVNLSAGTTSQNLSEFVFSNSNNVSFGLNGSTVTATITIPAQTNQTVGLYALGNTTQNSSTTLDARTLSFNAIGAATMGYSNGSIQVSVPAQTVQTQSNIQAVYDGANSISTGTIRFTNANGVSFSVNGQTVSASVAAQTVQTVGLYALGNTTQNSSSTFDARTISLNALGAMTVGYSNGSVQLSVPVQSVQTQSNVQAIYDGAASISTGTVRFSNSNGISFGVNGQTITASHNGITSQTNQTLGLYAVSNTTGQSSSSTFDARTLSFHGAGIASVGYSGGSVVFSVPAGAPSPVNFSAGTTSGNLGSVVFSNSNGVSFGLNGATITASVAVIADTFWFPFNEGVNVVGNQGQATLHVAPMQAHMLKQFDRVMFPVNFTNASNSTGSVTLSMWMAFYTKNASTLSLMHSISSSQALTFSGNNNSSAQRGVKLFSVGWTTTITEGQYYVGVVSRSTSGGTDASLSQVLVSQMNSNFSGLWNVASNRSNQWPLGFGVLSVSTAGLPSSIAFSNIDGTGSLAARPPSWFAISGTV